MSTGLTDNQVRGYKATLHNPRVSVEAKEHAQQVLEGDTAPKRAEGLQGEEHQSRHLGGKKATQTSTYFRSVPYSSIVTSHNVPPVDPDMSQEVER